MKTGDLADRVTRAAGGIRERAASAVTTDLGSVVREMTGVTRRVAAAESALSDRIDDLEDSLSSQIRAAMRTRSSWPRRIVWLVIGAGIGAGAAYLADPERGRSRRTQLSDQAAARARDARTDMMKKAKVRADRLRGDVIETAKDLLPERAPDDPQLLQDRIKSEVFGGRDDVQDVVLKVEDPGVVVVKGTVPSSESERELLARVVEVDGVIDVRSELTVRST